MCAICMCSLYYDIMNCLFYFQESSFSILEMVLKSETLVLISIYLSLAVFLIVGSDKLHVSLVLLE